MNQKLQNFIRDKNGSLVLWQKPNFPLSIVLIGVICGRIPTFSRYLGEIQAITTLFLGIWGFLELTQGLSPIRRVGGFIALCVAIFNTLSM